MNKTERFTSELTSVLRGERSAQHLQKLRLRLRGWYGQDSKEDRAKTGCDVVKCVTIALSNIWWKGGIKLFAPSLLSGKLTPLDKDESLCLVVDTLGEFLRIGVTMAGTDRAMLEMAYSLINALLVAYTNNPKNYSYSRSLLVLKEGVKALQPYIVTVHSERSRCLLADALVNVKGEYDVQLLDELRYQLCDGATFSKGSSAVAAGLYDLIMRSLRNGNYAWNDFVHYGMPHVLHVASKSCEYDLRCLPDRFDGFSVDTLLKVEETLEGLDDPNPEVDRVLRYLKSYVASPSH